MRGRKLHKIPGVMNRNMRDKKESPNEGTETIVDENDYFKLAAL